MAHNDKTIQNLECDRRQDKEVDRRDAVAGEQDHEVRYEANKARKSASAIKAAITKVGNMRKKVERKLAK